MSKTRGESSGHSELSMPFASFWPGAIPAGIPPWMRALSHLNGKGQVACLESQREWASFLSRRIQEDIKLVNRMAGCTTPRPHSVLIRITSTRRRPITSRNGQS